MSVGQAHPFVRSNDAGRINGEVSKHKDVKPNFLSQMY